MGMSAPGPPEATPAFLAVQQPGPSPAPMNSPLRVTARAEAEAEAAVLAAGIHAEARRAEQQKMPGLPILLGLDVVASMDRVAEYRAKSGEEDLLAWQRRAGRKYQQKDGYRTPSSWGSPPLSGVPTADNSPRGIAQSS